jgi:sulfoxide reductase heme-binding subunit YedZ
MRRPAGRLLLLWAVLAAPGLWLVGAWITGAATYGEVVSQSGLWSIEFFILALAVSPARRLFGVRAWTTYLLRRRRDLGVAAFCYGAGHTIVYLIRKADLNRILTEAREAWLLAGWAALAILAILAVTSNDASLRLLKRNWKRLHRFVYPAALLVFVHWVMSAFDPLAAYAHLAVLAGIEAIRFWPRRTDAG